MEGWTGRHIGSENGTSNLDTSSKNLYSVRNERKKKNGEKAGYKIENAIDKLQTIRCIVYGRTMQWVKNYQDSLSLAILDWTFLNFLPMAS